MGLLRFTLSYRDVEDLLAERSLDISYETIRSWVLKFGPVIARQVKSYETGAGDYIPFEPEEFEKWPETQSWGSLN